MSNGRLQHATDESADVRVPLRDSGAASAPEAVAEHEAFLRRWASHPERAAAIAAVTAFTSELVESTGTGFRLADHDLSGVDLSGFDLRAANLNRTRLYRTDLSRTNLAGASIICPGLERTRFCGANLRGAYVHALAAQVCDFTDADLRDLVDATGALFHGCTMRRARLEGAMLGGSSFYQTTLDGARFERTNLQSCSFVECSAVETSFVEAGLDHAMFTRSDLRAATFERAFGAGVVVQRPISAERLLLDGARFPALRMFAVRAAKISARGLSARGSDWQQCGLTEACFDAADLSDSSWIDVVAPSANLEGALLDGARWTRVLIDGARMRGAHAENWTVLEGSAAGADMEGLQARCLHVRNGDWRSVNLKRAYLYRAMITGDPPLSMTLAGANLEEAVLVQAYIAADLMGANLRNVAAAYVRLNQTRLTCARLDGARLFHASMVKTNLEGADLRGVEPPLFADRCPGLVESLDPSTASGKQLRAYLLELGAVLDKVPRGST